VRWITILGRELLIALSNDDAVKHFQPDDFDIAQQRLMGLLLLFFLITFVLCGQFIALSPLPAYGAIELAVALLALVLFVEKRTPSSSGEWLAGFLAPIYIAIRGMDNIDHAHDKPARGTSQERASRVSARRRRTR